LKGVLGQFIGGSFKGGVFDAGGAYGLSKRIQKIPIKFHAFFYHFRIHILMRLEGGERHGEKTPGFSSEVMLLYYYKKKKKDIK